MDISLSFRDEIISEATKKVLVVQKRMAHARNRQNKWRKNIDKTIMQLNNEIIHMDHISKRKEQVYRALLFVPFPEDIEEFYGKTFTRHLKRHVRNHSCIQAKTLLGGFSDVLDEPSFLDHKFLPCKITKPYLVYSDRYRAHICSKICI